MCVWQRTSRCLYKNILCLSLTSWCVLLGGNATVSANSHRLLSHLTLLSLELTLLLVLFLTSLPSTLFSFSLTLSLPFLSSPSSLSHTLSSLTLSSLSPFPQALNTPHFAKIKDFINMQMPSGFPIKFGMLPLPPFLSSSSLTPSFLLFPPLLHHRDSALPRDVGKGDLWQSQWPHLPCPSYHSPLCQRQSGIFYSDYPLCVLPDSG